MIWHVVKGCSLSVHVIHVHDARELTFLQQIRYPPNISHLNKLHYPPDISHLNKLHYPPNISHLNKLHYPPNINHLKVKYLDVNHGACIVTVLWHHAFNDGVRVKVQLICATLPNMQLVM